MKTVVIGMIGTGWAGTMHAKSYRLLHGIECRLKTVCSLDAGLEEFAAAYGFEQAVRDCEDIFNDEEIDCVDIVTPPSLHYSMIEAALKKGKHVICEKPVTGYFGEPEGQGGDPGSQGGDPGSQAGDPGGQAGDIRRRAGDMPKREMYRAVKKELDDLELLVKQSGRQFFYAENWIYSPPFVRMTELILKKGTRLLAINGETGHKGSHAGHAGRWSSNGGGSLIRQGTHPVAAALYLKRKELESRNEPYAVISVLCDSSALMAGREGAARGAVAARPEDVEDWSHLIITFSDGTKACITAGDVFLSGILNRMEVYGTDGVFRCNMTPNNLLNLYWSDDVNVEQEPVMEKNDRNLGWQNALVLEEHLRGYTGQLQDFMECMAGDRTPCSDFSLAKETLLVIYAAYVSAEEGRRIDMGELESR